MAKGKGKSTASSGPRLRKNHGPKRHMFKDYKPMVWQFGKMGLLTKYNNFESFCLACSARGKRNPTMNDFTQFMTLDKKGKDEYFKNLRK